MKGIEMRQLTARRHLSAVLRRILSPKMAQFIRFQWWFLSSYFPRLVASQLVTRKPQVRSFSETLTAPHPGKQLQGVNVIAPTKMCRIMTKYGSDKGRVHNYTSAYSALFKQRCNEPLRIFELGLGTNDPDLPSSMGLFGAPGASLRGWRELFPQALIYGADVDRRILFSEDRIKTFYCNQLDRSSIRELWAHRELGGGVDILIDDGLHTFEANATFLEESLSSLRPGGIYITEDILSGDLRKWQCQIEAIYSKQYMRHKFALVSLPNKADRDNNLLVIHRCKD